MSDVHEQMEHAEHVEHAAHSNKKIALVIAVLALFLAFSETLGKGAQTAALSQNIEASDLWNFFQAKTIRQTVLRTNPFYNFDGFQSDNSVQTNPSYGAPILRADPRLVRFGVRIAI